MRELAIGALMGLMVALAVALPVLIVSYEFLNTGLWFPIYDIPSPPGWLYDMATKRGTI